MNWPLLREELVVSEGPRDHHGAPTWTLLDPSRNRFFRLDWLTFEILQRWSLHDAQLILHQLKTQTPLTATLNDILAVVQFANTNLLFQHGGAPTSAALAGLRARSQPTWWQWLVHNYLFFRVPLLRPERFLHWLHAQVGFLFRPTFWWLTAAALVTGFALLWQQWETFKTTWIDHSNLNGVLGYLLVLVGIKVLHEFGHGLASTHFGCRVPTMGIAFLVMTPVAYTDTNDAWKLKDRRPRILIGAAGMITEVTLAIWATLAWGLLPDGYWRSAAFFVGTVTWIKSLVVNVSPIMRFDGYYLLSDSLDLPNLHSRAFALTRWQLREWLFRLGEPPPESFRSTLRHGLVALSAFIWIYRLVVFTGIAIFVYHFFFKALGILCFSIEIAWFVVLPIVSEIKVWFAKRKLIGRSGRLPWFFAGGALILVLLCIPLPRRIHVAGEMYPAQEYRLVAPEAARVVRIAARDGATVKAGDRLLELESDMLKLRLEKARKREETLRDSLTAAGGDLNRRSSLALLQGELETARAATREAEIAVSQLATTAPFDGVFHLADCDLNPGEAVSKQETLAVLAGQGAWQVTAYVDEQDSHLVAPGMRAHFEPGGLSGITLDFTVGTVDKDATHQLSHPVLATVHGGSVPARLDENEWIPEHGVCRVVLNTPSLPAELAAHIRRGHLVIYANAEPLILRWSRNVGSVLWRELGF